MKSSELKILPATATALKKATKDGYVVLTRGGKPVAYVLPAAIYDDEDIGYMLDPEFWKMIEQRRQQTERIPLEDIEREIAERERHEARETGTRRHRNGKRKAS